MQLNFIKIRQAKLEDLQSIAEIKVIGWKSAYRGIVADEYLNSISVSDQIYKLKNSYSIENIFVAENDNEILGYCRFYDYDKFINCDEEIDCEIREIYVRPDFKRKGIGSELFLHTKQYFKQNEKKKLCLSCLRDNYNARKFYEKMGATSKVGIDLIIGDKSYPCVSYVYNL